MDELLVKSEMLVDRTRTEFKRGLYEKIDWNNRLIGVKGSRGTGKTTLLLQRLKSLNHSPTEAAYFTLDDLYFTTNSLAETATQFYEKGGKILFLDEVHKYPHWAQHLKNLYDFYPDLQLVFTGSSIIDMARQEADLSRRALLYELPGLSYREYLAFEGILQAESFTLSEIISESRPWRGLLADGFKPLQHFDTYLATGYYPFFREDRAGFSQRVQQLIRLIVEYDMAELQDFDIRNARKMLQLLYILAANVPFKPNLTSLAEKSQIHRNSVNNYLHFLEQARLIRLLYPDGISVATLQKPEKIYLDNPNLAFALSGDKPDKGNFRETFFFNQLSHAHSVRQSKAADFLVDGIYPFEVGGKNKSQRQVDGLSNAYVVKDDVESSIGPTVPLWVFGFLY
jgi:predicted AAA+ superfamily ATPase